MNFKAFIFYSFIIFIFRFYSIIINLIINYNKIGVYINVSMFLYIKKILENIIQKYCIRQQLSLKALNNLMQRMDKII